MNYAARANALSMAVVTQLADACAVAESEGRVLVVTGAGSNFCSGADVKEMDGPDRDELMARTWDLMKRLQSLATPVVGAVNGPAVAGGVEIALCCDLRVATPAAYLRPRGAKWGAVTATRLARYVPLGIATEAIWLERRVEADVALHWGLYNRVVDAEELRGAVLEWADTLAELPASVVAASRSLLREPPRTWSEAIAGQAEASNPSSPSAHLRT